MSSMAACSRLGCALIVRLDRLMESVPSLLHCRVFFQKDIGKRFGHLIVLTIGSILDSNSLKRLHPDGRFDRKGNLSSQSVNRSRERLESRQRY